MEECDNAHFTKRYIVNDFLIVIFNLLILFIFINNLLFFCLTFSVNKYLFASIKVILIFLHKIKYIFVV